MITGEVFDAITASMPGLNISYCGMCRDPSGTISDATPGVDSGLNVRTIVHEYGGGDFLIGDGAVYFSNFK